MSDIKKNYEKLVLIIAALIAVVFFVMIFLTSKKLKTEFELPDMAKGKALPIMGQAEVKRSAAQLSESSEWEQGDYQGREVDLFTGVALYVQEGKSKPIDLVKSDPVHGEIPNAWWAKHQLNPGFSDSPLQDPDGDGFSNQEEFEAKTNPTQKSDHPSLAGKLAIAEVKASMFKLIYSLNAGETHQFRYRDTKGNNLRSDFLKVGDLLFSKENHPADKRFLLQEVGQAEMVMPRGNKKKMKDFAILIDQNPSFKGREIKVVRGRIGNKEGALVKDFRVVLQLNALGLEGEKFELKPNEVFSLPFDETSLEKPYKVKEITDQKVVISFSKEGKEELLELVK